MEKSPVNSISATMLEDEQNGHFLETWNTCPDCGTKWKDKIRIEGILHRTRLCDACILHDHGISFSKTK